MQLPGELSHKAGPLPVWGWALILGGAGFLLWRSKSKSSATNTQPAYVGTGNGAIGGGGSGGGVGASSTPPGVTPPPNAVTPVAPVAVVPAPAPFNYAAAGINQQGASINYPGSPGLLTGFTNYGIDLGLGGPTGQGPGVFSTLYKPQAQQQSYTPYSAMGNAAAAVSPAFSYQAAPASTPYLNFHGV